MKVLYITTLSLALIGTALAQAPAPALPLVPSVAATVAAMPRDLPRAKGPRLHESIQLAQAAVDACTAKGGKVSVLVVDSVGEPIVLLSGDGAGVRSQLIARTKAATVIKYKMPNREVQTKAKTDPGLQAEIAANPNIGVVRGGAFPLMRGSEMIGAIAVSGFTGQDDACAKEALAKVPLR